MEQFLHDTFCHVEDKWSPFIRWDFFLNQLIKDRSLEISRVKSKTFEGNFGLN